MNNLQLDKCTFLKYSHLQSVDLETGARSHSRSLEMKSFDLMFKSNYGFILHRF